MNSPRAHTCPPGPELLENDNSTNSFGIFPAAPPNCVTHAEAFALSSSVKSSESDGGLGSPGMPTALWTPKRWFPLKVARHKGDLVGLKGDLSTIERRWTSIEKKKFQCLVIERYINVYLEPSWTSSHQEELFATCLQTKLEMNKIRRRHVLLVLCLLVYEMSLFPWLRCKWIISMPLNYIAQLLQSTFFHLLCLRILRCSLSSRLQVSLLVDC